ncbi:hypothetical protein C2E23DRAFT_842446 [Lenzites betulinus]|nr:hypothetical protein C2E23DRAFT_842446 [Lenzites betulinus]
MPGHHRVHFADVPSTPSSTFSDATLASSPGPATPQSLLSTPLPSKHYNTPSPSYYATLPLPGAPVQVHPVLACTPGFGAPLTWDLAELVESVLVRTSTALRPLSEHLVAEAATVPKLASITIVCDRLPWSITVAPKQDAPWAAPYVTVGDVLFTLYRTLRLGVTAAELATVDPASHQRVHAAYVKRCERVQHRDQRAAEMNKGAKRVDFLCDARMFKGLSAVPEGNPAKGLAPGVVWRLHTSRP